jgi:hypothetical protein
VDGSVTAPQDNTQPTTCSFSSGGIITIKTYTPSRSSQSGSPFFFYPKLARDGLLADEGALMAADEQCIDDQLLCHIERI